MSDEIPVLDINAEDREAEALRYADAVEQWRKKRQRKECDDDCEATDHGVHQPSWKRDESERQFEWPCDRRDAHHPHPEDGCPGVRAHPLTQIGGNYKKNEVPK